MRKPQPAKAPATAAVPLPKPTPPANAAEEEATKRDKGAEPHVRLRDSRRPSPPPALGPVSVCISYSRLSSYSMDRETSLSLWRQASRVTSSNPVASPDLYVHRALLSSVSYKSTCMTPKVSYYILQIEGNFLFHSSGRRMVSTQCVSTFFRERIMKVLSSRLQSSLSENTKNNAAVVGHAPTTAGHRLPLRERRPRTRSASRQTPR